MASHKPFTATNESMHGCYKVILMDRLITVMIEIKLRVASRVSVQFGNEHATSTVQVGSLMLSESIPQENQLQNTTCLK
jgi:hypothetical protein